MSMIRKIKVPMTARERIFLVEIIDLYKSDFEKLINNTGIEFPVPIDRDAVEEKFRVLGSLRQKIMTGKAI
jgi:hypothetical protein